MLVLSRKLNEAIVIGHDITVMVIEIRRDKVRLGIEAKPGISINRSEIEEKIAAAGVQKKGPKVEGE